MSQRLCLLICLSLSALLLPGCEVFVDFDEDELDAGRTVDPVPIADGATPRGDAAVRSDAAVVPPAPVMDASITDAALADAAPAAQPDAGDGQVDASDGGASVIEVDAGP